MVRGLVPAGLLSLKPLPEPAGAEESPEPAAAPVAADESSKHWYIIHTYSGFDLVIDAGSCGTEPRTVIDLTQETPLVLRKGKGSLAPFSVEPV